MLVSSCQTGVKSGSLQSTEGNLSSRILIHTTSLPVLYTHIELNNVNIYMHVCASVEVAFSLLIQAASSSFINNETLFDQSVLC
jgi:hypothetical protein